jgi:hypothetical protein
MKIQYFFQFLPQSFIENCRVRLSIFFNYFFLHLPIISNPTANHALITPLSSPVGQQAENNRFLEKRL